MDYCRCCGGQENSDRSCSEPITRVQCKYFSLDFNKPKGKRFVCSANGQIDGNCNGELNYSKQS